MKITYTNKPDALTTPQLKKVDDRFAKLAKMIDMRGGEREAHVILNQERHLTHAEITVRFHDHALVGVGSSPEIFTAITDAQDKIEKQILKLREKFRDNKRGPKEGEVSEEELEIAPAPARVAAEIVETEAGEGRRVFRIDHHERRKPMTIEEALLEMDKVKGLDYVVYRDAESDRVSVLIRRRDGNFDLVEA